MVAPLVTCPLFRRWSVLHAQQCAPGDWGSCNYVLQSLIVQFLCEYHIGHGLPLHITAGHAWCVPPPSVVGFTIHVPL